MREYRLTDTQREYHKLKKRESRVRIAKVRTPEETKALNRAQYERHKERYKSKSRAWQNANRPKQQAIAHQAQVRLRYPEVWARSSITNQQLVDWVTQRRGCPCLYCGAASTHIDHRIALAGGGEHCFSNLQMICKDCNLAKRDRAEEEFLGWARRIGELNSVSVV